MKKFFADFKKFISRGNILDMAVGVIVGSAFSTIVTAFTNGIIMPLIKMLLALVGGDGLDSVYTILHGVYTTDATTGESVLDLTNSIYIDWGAFITAIINFLIIAFTLFIILRVAMRSSEMFKKAEEEAKKSRLTKEDKLELKKRGISLRDREAVKEYKLEKQKLLEEKAKLEAEEKERKAKEDAINNPSQEQLLKDIRDLLREMQTDNSKQVKSAK